MGGVLFSLIMMVVFGVVASLLVRRVILKYNAITKRLSDVKSKSSKQTPSGTSNLKVESPTLEATLLEGVVTEFKEVELDGEYAGACLTRQSASPTMKLVPTHQDVNSIVQGSTE
jgi:Na+/H+ antiporter NhaD/arsenite permease-like protein